MVVSQATVTMVRDRATSEGREECSDNRILHSTITITNNLLLLAPLIAPHRASPPFSLTLVMLSLHKFPTASLIVLHSPNLMYLLLAI